MSSQSPFRAIPQIEKLLSSEPFRALLETYPRRQVLRRLREILDTVRAAMATGRLMDLADLTPEALAGRTAQRLERRAARHYRRVINATGVVLHTNLGRAPLAPEAVAALAETAPYAQRLEVDLDTGRRGGRDAGCRELAVELLGCEDATVVNNNAAATLVILATLARGKDVIVSRGELVEIGGSYRVPEILRESGARLREVGTTNRTHLRDYRAALDDAEREGREVGLLLKVHTSNYRVIGFTAEVELAELAELGAKRQVPVVHDLGSGSLVDLDAHGLEGETEVRHSLEAGAGLVCFSGDKLLGGPQAGLIVGRAELVQRCRKHPLFRALRPGRLIYTALEATLKLYLGGPEAARERVPALARLTATTETLQARAGRLHAAVDSIDGLSAEIVETRSQAGSGSLPTVDVPSFGVRVRADALPVDDLATRLRDRDPAIFARTRDDALEFDARTVTDDEVAEIARALTEAVAPTSSGRGPNS